MISKQNFNYSTYFDSILDIYNVLNLNDNLVIGGTFSLILHDLKVNVEPGDIDLIIYNPTKEQIKILDFYKVFCEKNPIDKYQRRSYKMKINNIQLDILIENKEVSKELLYFKYKDIYFKVQDINNVFNAKQSYNYNEIRRKDLIQSNFMKQNNFNII